MIASLMPSVLTIACPSSAEDPRTDRNGRFYFAQKKVVDRYADICYNDHDQRRNRKDAGTYGGPALL